MLTAFEMSNGFYKKSEYSFIKGVANPDLVLGIDRAQIPHILKAQSSRLANGFIV
jgi:hypothetical protein